MADLLTTDVSKYIWHILSLKPYVLMSWGVDTDTLESSDDSLEFHVDGFKHTGNVRITLVEGTDSFQVSLYTDDSTLKGTINDVLVDNLTDVIDMNVENDNPEDYDHKVINWLIKEAV